ncbi:hypothetical protein CYMTET_44766, partial [Cymbomonas tetramitiformis]
MNTLDRYLVRRAEDVQGAEISARERVKETAHAEPEAEVNRASFFSPMSYECSGRLSLKVRCTFAQEYRTKFAAKWQLYSPPRAATPLNVWEEPTARYSQPMISGPAPIIASEFDSCGQLLALGGASGEIRILDYSELRAAGKSAGTQIPDGVLQLQTERSLDALTWDPAGETKIACVSARAREVYIYDLEYCAPRGPPNEVLTDTPSAARQYGGLNDVCYGREGRYRVLAAGSDGRVRLWDRRAAATKPRAVVGMHHSSGAATTLQVSEDGQVVFAGSSEGFVHTWDLRGGRTGGGAFAQRVDQVYHPPLSSHDVGALLAAVPGLTSEVDIERSGVKCL